MDQTGSFYEVYAWNECDEQIKVSRDILQIRLTKKGGSRTCNKEPAWMAGFPDHSYKRFEKRLLSEKYTIVYVDQISRDPIKRGVVRVCSPGCTFDGDDDEHDSILLCVCIEQDGTDYYCYYSNYDSNRGEISIISCVQEPGVSLSQIYDSLEEYVESHGVNEIVLHMICNEEKVNVCEFRSDVLVHTRVISPSVARREIFDSVYQKKYCLNIFLNIVVFMRMSMTVLI